MHSTINAADLDRLAPTMDRNARELAHSNVAPCDAPTFAVAYVCATAETCGALAAAQCAPGEEWSPEGWLQGDREAVQEAAALCGVELEGDDWRELRALYARPSDSAYVVCGLARP